MANRPNIFVDSSIPTYVYVRTQGFTRCCVCSELTGGVAHLAGVLPVCLTCHVNAATTLWEVRH